MRLQTKYHNTRTLAIVNRKASAANITQSKVFFPDNGDLNDAWITHITVFDSAITGSSGSSNSIVDGERFQSFNGDEMLQVVIALVDRDNNQNIQYYPISLATWQNTAGYKNVLIRLNQKFDIRKCYAMTFLAGWPVGKGFALELGYRYK